MNRGSRPPLPLQALRLPRVDGLGERREDERDDELALRVRLDSGAAGVAEAVCGGLEGFEGGDEVEGRRPRVIVHGTHRP